jgi:flagellar hook-length control protein FliK
MKDIKLTTNSAQSQQSDADDNATSEESPNTQPQAVLQNAAAPATPLILPAAAADKSIQASVTQMDNAAIKVQQAVQTPQPSAVVATQQLAASEQVQTNNNDSLTPQVGSPAWDQALGQKVVWMAGGGQQSASLTLNPPDLGPMQVVLSVNNAHATVTFTSAQPEVRQALENAMPKLREMLGDAGIQLGQASINSGSAQQQHTASQQNSGNSQSRASGNAVDSIEAAATSIVRASPVSAGLGLVDTFA